MLSRGGWDPGKLQPRVLPITVLGSACPAPAEESGVGWAAAARLDTWSSSLGTSRQSVARGLILSGAGRDRATAAHPQRIWAGSGRDFSDLCRASALSCRFYGGLLGFIRVCWDLYSNWEVLQIRVGPERASRVARACKGGASSGSETIPGGGQFMCPVLDALYVFLCFFIGKMFFLPFLVVYHLYCRGKSGPST